MQVTECALTKASELRVFSPPDRLEMFFQLFFGGLTLKQSNDFIIYQHFSICIVSVFQDMSVAQTSERCSMSVLLRK